MTDEQEYRVSLAGIRWGVGLVMVLIICCTAYQIVERIGPVRPHEVQMYTWPAGTPSKP